MKRFLFSIFLSLLIFMGLNFIYCNLDGETFNYPMTFKFTIPGIIGLRSLPIPAGFILIASFSLGMIFFSLVQALPALYRSLATRKHKGRIKDLEKEVEKLREKRIGLSGAEPEESSEFLDNPL
ncbi:MAG: hypothetical protein Q7S98_05165 [Deltaproteobacteria bacterium]|nr:hypothetical protein [Deltaproteobacteria bacterium]